MSDESDLFGGLLDQMWGDVIATEAAARQRLHVDHPSRRALSEGYDLVGLSGEVGFARDYRQPLDLELRAGGDAGYDFAIPLRFTVNVKAFRRPLHLIHEEGKVVADIYVLASHNDETMRARMIGWEWGRILARAPVRDFGYGVINHYIPAETLRPMRELGERIMHLR